MVQDLARAVVAPANGHRSNPRKGLDSAASPRSMFPVCSQETPMHMARQMESGFTLVARVERELPAVAGFFAPD
jgi:hypothetical protein